MNSTILQRHLEQKFTRYVRACASEQATDDGLIVEILDAPILDDQKKLSYIGRIDSRLDRVPVPEIRSEWSLNSRYGDAEETGSAWVSVCMRFSKKADHEMDRETCLSLAIALENI